jgi:hypothetical protein
MPDGPQPRTQVESQVGYVLALRPLPPRGSNRRVRLDVFEFRERLVGECSQFTRSFTRIRSADIASFVAAAYESQRDWPAPLVQVNPNFRNEHSVDQLDRPRRTLPQHLQRGTCRTQACGGGGSAGRSARSVAAIS